MGVPDAAEKHWRGHLGISAKIELGAEAAALVNLSHHYG